MPGLLEAVRLFDLTEFFFSLSIQDKEHMKKYSKYLSCYPKNMTSCHPDCDGGFMVTNSAQFLWATAANAIPDGKLGFAERLLLQALSLAEQTDDLAWIHANLAQVYYDAHKSDPDAGRKSISHCRELVKLGYMKTWAKNMMEELLVFQV